MPTTAPGTDSPRSTRPITSPTSTSGGSGGLWSAASSNACLTESSTSVTIAPISSSLLPK